MHLYVGGRPEGLTGPDMEAAQQLVHLSGDEEESDNHGGRKAKPAGVAKSTIQFEGDQEEKVTRREAKGAAEVDAHDEEDEGDKDEDDRRTTPRKRRFRSIAYIYKVTRPVRLHDIEAKRRKSH